jgi:hypothetical protein
MLRSQDTLTVIAPIKPAQEPKLRQLLEEIQAAIQGGSAASARVPLGLMPSVHFARWTILEEVKVHGERGGLHPASLLFSTEYDGTREEHLQELINDGSRGALIDIYSQCEGFEAEGGPDTVRLRRYLEAHTVKPSVYFVGAIGRSVERIRLEAKIAGEIRDFADDTRLAGVDPIVAWRMVRDFATEHGYLGDNLAGKALVSRAQKRRQRAWLWIRVALIAVPGLALVYISQVRFSVFISLLFVGLASIVFLAFLLRLREDQNAAQLEAEEAATSTAESSVRDAQHAAKLERFEVSLQNQMTTVTLLKPGRLRQWLQRLVLVVVRLRAKYKFSEGLLSGVPTIHFAHWHLLEGKTRLLFISNYDGSWASYLEDFILHASRALTAIWSHSVDFPRTRFLVFDGATDGPRFKAFARRHQVPPVVWYCAYPELSLSEINRNTRLVAGLCNRKLGQAEHRALARDWLKEI